MGILRFLDPLVLPAQAGTYWSSTTYTNDTSLAFLLLFAGTGVAPDVKTDAAAVRAVRGGS